MRLPVASATQTGAERTGRRFAPSLSKNLSVHEVAGYAGRVQIFVGEELLASCTVATSFGARFKGLLGVSYLEKSQGLIIPHCRQIHMLFMKIPLDLVFFDAAGEIKWVRKHIRPWRFSPVILGAFGVVELGAGTLDNTPTALPKTPLTFSPLVPPLVPEVDKLQQREPEPQ